MKAILTKICKCEAKGVDYDPSYSLRGKVKRTEKDSPDHASLLYTCTESGLSTADATAYCNANREQADISSVSGTAVATWVASDNLLVSHKRHHRKEREQKDEWCNSRMIQAQQLKEQLDAGANSLPCVPNKPTIPSIRLNRLIFFDEHHEKVRLGHASTTEVLVRRDKNGQPSPEGEFPPTRPITGVKFSQEVIGCFGVAMRENTRGELEGSI